MTRPLRYDDQFVNIINEKIHEKFLHIFNIKVQSTAFSQKLNLQKSLLIVSLFDLVIGIVFIIALFESVKEMQEDLIFFLENFILMIGTFFGMLGIDSSTNLRKTNTRVYKNWRIFVTFAFPFLELINNFSFLCHYFSNCYKLQNFIIITILFLINIYFSKIAWSFYIRLSKGHELLIIHGKYLEKMMNDESYKLNDIKRYVPPQQLTGNKLISSTNTTLGVDSEMSMIQNKTPTK